jgi:hypothetical protein
MAYDHELVQGVDICSLGAPERLALLGFRLIASGARSAPQLADAFQRMLHQQGRAAITGLETLADRLPLESQRPITLCAASVRGVSYDEAAVLALLEAAQRSAARDIYTWLRRLGVHAMSPDLQRGIVWAAAAFIASDQRFDPSVARLTWARKPVSAAYAFRSR